MPPREVLIANRHPRLRLDRRAVKRMIHLLDAHAEDFRPSPITHHLSPTDELSVVFLTDPALAKLHGDFLHDPSPTDVITFSGDPALKTAGEICVSADAARRQAGARGNFSAELTLYLVHGWLHLVGFDDLQPAKKRQMRRAEARAIKLLRTAHALPRFSFRV